MAFLDKVNQMAKNLGEKTSDVIETTKLTAKISAEKSAANTELTKIGEFYYKKFLAGEEVATEILEFCNAAKTHYDNIAAARVEIENIKNDNASAETSQDASQNAGGTFCTSCGEQVADDVNFCPSCGNKIQ